MSGFGGIISEVMCAESLVQCSSPGSHSAGPSGRGWTGWVTLALCHHVQLPCES